MEDFVHLHVHSEYSLLDGLGRTGQLAAEAARLGQPALALTDHGVMHGAIEFFRDCKKKNVKPIIGVEAYLTPFGRKMSDRDSTKDNVRHHLLLLAQNMTGYKNLLKICSTAQMQGFYYKPRIDADFLAAHAEGLICTTGCMAAEIPALLTGEEGRPPQPERALERLRWYLEVFGRDRFYVELQEHSIPELTRLNHTLFDWAKQHDLGLLVTNDVHYVTEVEAKAHDTLLCVQTTSLIKQPNRLRFSDNSYYLKSLAELRAAFRPLVDLPESAFSNSLKIAEMCEVDLEDSSFHLPDLPTAHLPDEVMPRRFKDSKDYPGFLRYLTEKGLQEKYGERANSPEIRARMEHELNIINGMGFAIYYLIVWDLCRFAHEQGIWWNVRGSGAGSIVAYATGITLIEPLRHNLIFERFLNPGRISMPDFDLDYPDDQRERMIEYTIQRYGSDRVAQIVSFGRMKARAAIRDVGRAMDIPLAEVDTIAKQITAIPGKPCTIDDALNPEHEFYAPELKEQYDQVEHVKELVDFARNLEGVARHSSVHAAAVIITDKSLTEYVPVMRAQGSVITEAVTQFEFPICESIGLLKVDFLGLSTLTIMRKVAELIKERHNLDFDLTNIPMDQPEAFKELPHLPPPEKAFELLAKGDVTGVFQVEGCLSGDTFIGHRTIRELYEDFTVRPSSESIPWMNRLKATSCYLDEGRLSRNAIQRVVYSGVKPVYRLVDERGYWIKATADHHFLTQRGWVRLGDLNFEADLLLVKSDASRLGRLCLECGQPLKSVSKRAQSCKTCSARTTANPSRPEVRAKISASKLGSIPWNKGLTAETAADTLWIQNLKKYNDSQRGLSLEERIGPEKAARFKARLSELFSGSGNPMYGRPPKTTKTYTQDGYRTDLKHYVRSSWEADLARVFRYLELNYEYEPRTFELITPQGRRLTYTPDFYVPALNQWFEVKGWMDKVSVEKIALFKEQYPDCELVIVDKTLFAEFQLQYADLVEWECPRFPPNSQWVKIQTIEFLGEEATYDLQMRPPGNNFVANSFIVHNSGMRRVLTDMKPTRFEHIVAAISLFRPGPMEYIPTYIARMHGKEPVEYKHPRLESILAETYGIIVYQEQIIQIAAQLAGYAPGEADQIRKAVGKKIKAKIEEHRSKFVEGAVANGIEKEVAEAIYGDIEFFARYGFNKAHAADYALVTCQTAYLKAHFPVEYMAALLTVERNNTEKVGLLVGECRSMGIPVLPPHVNYSRIDFTIEDKPSGGNALSQTNGSAIRFGMSAIKNVGEGPISDILAARDQDGPFADIDDFCQRVDLRHIGRRALEGLIKVGALDCFGKRTQLLAIVDRMINLSSSTHKAASVGQISMFDMGSFDAPQTGSILYPLPEVEEVNQKDILAWEKELVGTYLLDHPTQKFMADIKAANATLLAELDESMHGRQVNVAGVISSIRHHQSKKGEPMAFIEIEDAQATREVIVFPRAFAAYKTLLIEGKLIFVRGKVDAAQEGRPPKILADTITTELTSYHASNGDTPAPRPNGANGNGAAKPAASSAYRLPEPPALPPDILLAEAPVAYHTPESLPPAIPPIVDETLARWLHIRIPPTGNLPRDKERMRRIFALLTDRPGNDLFSFHIPNGPKEIQIDFPNQTTKYTEYLRQQLNLAGITDVWLD